MSYKPNIVFKTFRKSLDLSQTELATKLAVSQGTITDIERGRIGVSKRIVKKIMDIFKLNYTEIQSKILSIDNQFNEKIPRIDTENNTEDDFILLTKEQEDDIKAKTKKRIETLLDKFKNSENSAFPADYFGENNFYLKSNFEKKLLLDIAHNFKEINELHTFLNDLRTFEYIIGNLNHYYFNKIDIQFHSVEKYLEKGIFNYEKYRTDYFAELQKLDAIKPALARITGAIKEFYNTIQPFDTENIIDGYFGKQNAETSIK